MMNETAGDGRTIRVFLPDDHEIVRHGVRELLERRILELVGAGLINPQIGERMYLAEKTVKNYVSALFAKPGMERGTQAAA